MATETNRRIYEKLKQLWLGEHDPDDRDAADIEFDRFVADMMREGGQIVAAEAKEDSEDGVSQSRMLMEMILEVDTAIQMVPPRLKKYRDLLAAEGLDKASTVAGEDGQKGLAGINLADQAALEFHRALLGLSINVAQAEVMERMNRKPMTDADR